MNVFRGVAAVVILLCLHAQTALSQSTARVEGQEGDQETSLTAVTRSGFETPGYVKGNVAQADGHAPAQAAPVRLLPNMCTVRPVFTAHRYDSSIERSMDLSLIHI